MKAFYKKYFWESVTGKLVTDYWRTGKLVTGYLLLENW